jgi:hypothetical protein
MFNMCVSCSLLILLVTYLNIKLLGSAAGAIRNMQAYAQCLRASDKGISSEFIDVLGIELSRAEMAGWNTVQEIMEECQYRNKMVYK